MRMCTTLMACALLLAACTAAEHEETGKGGVPHISLTEELSPQTASGARAGTGARAERLLSTGILEVGDEQASLVLLTFTNNACGYCREFQEGHFGRLVEDFIQTGKLRVQFIILPLKKYPQSKTAAAAVVCAVEQERGLAVFTALFKGKQDRSRVFSLARTFALDEEEFRSCMEDTALDLLLSQQETFAQSLGVSLIPTFFLNGERLIGLPAYSELRGWIEAQHSPP